MKTHFYTITYGLIKTVKAPINQQNSLLTISSNIYVPTYHIYRLK